MANMTKEQRALVLDYLVSQVVEKAQLSKSGSAALVPSVSEFEAGKLHRVDVNENYEPVTCDCKGFKHSGHCIHITAVAIYYVPRLGNLLDNENNPKYQFSRNGNTVVARLSQFSKAEKAALREYEQAQNEAALQAWRNEQEAKRRAIYEQAFDPNGLAFIA